MFTGIVEEQGMVVSLVQASQNTRLTVAVKTVAADLKIGDSLAVNGVCLTVTNLRRNFVEFDISPETSKKSTLSELKVGEAVNLERALRLSDRLGGHMVTGHVDGICEIKQKMAYGKGFELHISIPSELLRYFVPKGSVAVDGVSLTVADICNNLLVVAVIPHTCYVTTLSENKVGDKVNIEVDLLSKYIERQLQRENPSSISEDMLLQAGILPMGWIDN